ncbi:hypothetical protein SCOR_03430 [Sulfidibacter corallicola]
MIEPRKRRTLMCHQVPIHSCFPMFMGSRPSRNDKVTTAESVYLDGHDIGESTYLKTTELTPFSTRFSW